ncbi:hypothetical protein EGR_07398 [Echinococcus granulosus]|uniref:Uncharacterized protein n=1 Tax=Echinococcus granulosus TaxID=6210 RepID=W6U8T4_ECHGR|nr:hypothetical protein EGR_07398 [Echinococcus granulosus]EUB57738.1 hypothetical protein EGR_07398 [Echinococcus granulosus]
MLRHACGICASHWLEEEEERTQSPLTFCTSWVMQALLYSHIPNVASSWKYVKTPASNRPEGGLKSSAPVDCRPPTFPLIARLSLGGSVVGASKTHSLGLD